MARATKKRRFETADDTAEEKMLNLSEVGRRCGRTSTTIGRWIADGLLPCHRLPNGLRVIPESAVDAFIGGSNLEAKQ